MSQKIRFIFTFLLLALTVSCGFKKFNQGENSFYIQNIDVTGKRINAYGLKNNILINSDKNSENNYNLEIKLTERKYTKIKDKTGKTTRYAVEIRAETTLENVHTQKLINKSFTRNSDYNVEKVHSDTIRNKKNITKKIIQNLSEDITNFISFSKKN